MSQNTTKLIFEWKGDERPGFEYVDKLYYLFKRLDLVDRVTRNLQAEVHWLHLTKGIEAATNFLDAVLGDWQ